jgi:hypothetical protein
MFSEVLVYVHLTPLFLGLWLGKTPWQAAHGRTNCSLHDGQEEERKTEMREMYTTHVHTPSGSLPPNRFHLPTLPPSLNTPFKLLVHKWDNSLMRHNQKCGNMIHSFRHIYSTKMIPQMSFVDCPIYITRTLVIRFT